MPEIYCRKCGALTNTAFADHINSKDDKADGCYAKFIDGLWHKGCSFDEADSLTKSVVNSTAKKWNDAKNSTERKENDDRA